MSENDEKGAQKLAVMIVSMIGFATLLVIFSCYRICLEKWRQRKQQQLPPNQNEPSRIYNVVNQTPQTSDITMTQQSDYQLIFGAGSSNFSITSVTGEFTTSSKYQIKDMVRNHHLTDLQNEYGRAEGRSENSNVKEYIPPYNAKDYSLPSYDQAVNVQGDKIKITL